MVLCYTNTFSEPQGTLMTAEVVRMIFKSSMIMEAVEAGMKAAEGVGV